MLSGPECRAGPVGSPDLEDLGEVGLDGALLIPSCRAICLFAIPSHERLSPLTPAEGVLPERVPGTPVGAPSHPSVDPGCPAAA